MAELSSPDPLVSVLMPVYNGERYIQHAIRSVLRQTYAHFELVIIDDGSTDSTRDRISELNDSRIVLVISSRNRGISASRNAGLEHAKGDYVAWLDSDDISVPTRLARQVAFLEENPEYGLCAGNVASIDQTGERVRGRWWPGMNLPLEWYMAWGNPIAQSTVMVRNSIVRSHQLRYDGSKDPSEDYDFWCRLSRHTRLFRMGQVLTFYRVRSDSAFRMAPRKALEASRATNNEYVRGLCDTPVPPFHACLTQFGGQMPGQEGDESIWRTARWVRLVAQSIGKRKGLSPAVVSRLFADGCRMLLKRAMEDTDLQTAAWNLLFFLRHAPWLGGTLSLHLAKREARLLVAPLLRKRAA